MCHCCFCASDVCACVSICCTIYEQCCPCCFYLGDVCEDRRIISALLCGWMNLNPTRSFLFRSSKAVMIIFFKKLNAMNHCSVWIKTPGKLREFSVFLGTSMLPVLYRLCCVCKLFRQRLHSWRNRICILKDTALWHNSDVTVSRANRCIEKPFLWGICATKTLYNFG